MLIPRNLSLHGGTWCRDFQTNIKHGNCKERDAQPLSMLSQAQKVHLYPELLLVTELVSFLGTELLVQLLLHWVYRPQTSLVVTAGKRKHFSEDWCAPCFQDYSPIAGMSSQITPNSMRFSMCCSSNHCYKPVPCDVTSTSLVTPHFGLMLFLLGDKTSVHPLHSVKFVLTANPNSQAPNFHMPPLKCWSQKQDVYCSHQGLLVSCSPQSQRKGQSPNYLRITLSCKSELFPVQLDPESYSVPHWCQQH